MAIVLVPVAAPSHLEKESWTRPCQAAPAVVEERESQKAGDCHNSSKNYPLAEFRHRKRDMYYS